MSFDVTLTLTCTILTSCRSPQHPKEVSLVNVDGHFDLPAGFVGVHMDENPHIQPPSFFVFFLKLSVCVCVCVEAINW